MRDVTRDVIVTSGTLAPKSWVYQILNFENRTIIKGDTAIFVRRAWKKQQKFIIAQGIWEDFTLKGNWKDVGNFYESVVLDPGNQFWLLVGATDMTKILLDEVDLHSCEKNPELSVAL